jgi:glutathione-independent formaldehyde dehydrogenase
VLKYNRQLMQAILWDRLPIAKIVNVKVIKLEQAPEGYKSFDAGVANKFVIDPHGQLPKAAPRGRAIGLAAGHGGGPGGGG